MYPRVTSFSNFHFHESPWRTQTDAPNAMARTHKVVKVLHSQIPPKQLMLMEEHERKNKELLNK